MVSQQSFFPGELLLQTLFRDRYFILSKVGEGGFGSVYKARDIQNRDRFVAIKEVCLVCLRWMYTKGPLTSLMCNRSYRNWTPSGLASARASGGQNWAISHSRAVQDVLPELENGQIALQFPFMHVLAVIRPLDAFGLDETLVDEIAKRVANERIFAQGF